MILIVIIIIEEEEAMEYLVENTELSRKPLHSSEGIVQSDHEYLNFIQSFVAGLSS